MKLRHDPQNDSHSRARVWRQASTNSCRMRECHVMARERGAWGSRLPRPRIVFSCSLHVEYCRYVRIFTWPLGMPSKQLIPYSSFCFRIHKLQRQCDAAVTRPVTRWVIFALALVPWRSMIFYGNLDGTMLRHFFANQFTGFADTSCVCTLSF